MILLRFDAKVSAFCKESNDHPILLPKLCETSSKFDFLCLQIDKSHPIHPRNFVAKKKKKVREFGNLILSCGRGVDGETASFVTPLLSAPS